MSNAMTALIQIALTPRSIAKVVKWILVFPVRTLRIIQPALLVISFFRTSS